MEFGTSSWEAPEGGSFVPRATLNGGAPSPMPAWSKAGVSEIRGVSYSHEGRIRCTTGGASSLRAGKRRAHNARGARCAKRAARRAPLSSAALMRALSPAATLRASLRATQYIGSLAGSLAGSLPETRQAAVRTSAPRCAALPPRHARAARAPRAACGAPRVCAPRAPRVASAALVRASGAGASGRAHFSTPASVAGPVEAGRLWPNPNWLTA